MAAVGVVSSTGHLIELADGGHHGARVLLMHRLSSRDISVWIDRGSSSCQSVLLISLKSSLDLQAVEIQIEKRRHFARLSLEISLLVLAFCCRHSLGTRFVGAALAEKSHVADTP